MDALIRWFNSLKSDSNKYEEVSDLTPLPVQVLSSTTDTLLGYVIDTVNRWLGVRLVAQKKTIDTDNSSTAVLGAGATFTGIAHDSLNHESGRVTCKTDQAGTITVEQSTDGVNWDVSDQRTLVANTTMRFSFALGSAFHRVKVTNTAGSAQTFLRLQTILFPSHGVFPSTLDTSGNLKTGTADGSNVALGTTTDAAVVTDSNGTGIGFWRGLVKLAAAIRDTTNARDAVFQKPIATVPALYRSALTATDLLASVGTVTTSLLTGVGSMTAQATVVRIAAKNQFGRTLTTAGTSRTTTGSNLAIRAAWAQVPGATHYDIFVGLAGSEIWVGRVQESDRATGFILSTAGTASANCVLTAGGTAGAIDIYVNPTGTQAASNLAQNTAFVIPAQSVDGAGYRYLELDFICTRIGDGAAPSLIVEPFTFNATLNDWVSMGSYSLSFGGTSCLFDAMYQNLRLEIFGRKVAVLIGSIAGTGMSVDMYTSLSN